jgi:hypothetical protein
MLSPIPCFALHKAKKPGSFQNRAFAINGRRGGIRTRDPLHPIHFWVDFGGFPWINKIL